MKNKYWILIIGAVLALCVVLVLLPPQDTPSELAQIKYGSKTTTVDLHATTRLQSKTEKLPSPKPTAPTSIAFGKVSATAVSKSYVCPINW